MRFGIMQKVLISQEELREIKALILRLAKLLGVDLRSIERPKEEKTYGDE